MARDEQMNSTSVYFDRNLRSVSAIVAAQHHDETLFRVCSAEPHRIKKDSISKFSSPRLHRLKSSKVSPDQTVFHFDDSSDLSMSVVLPLHQSKTRMNLSKTSSRCCVVSLLLMCLSLMLICGLILGFVLIGLLIPWKKN